MPEWFEPILGYLVRVVQAAIAIAVAYLVVKYLDRLVTYFVKIEEHEYLERFLVFLKAVVYAIAALTAISFLSTEPVVFAVMLLAVGIAVVVMFSDVLRNLGSELFVRSSKAFRIGDWVEVDGVQGRVSSMTSLGVVVETLRRERVFIPYTRLAHTKVVNRSGVYGVSLRLEVRVPKTYDVSRARELIASTLQTVREDLIAEPSVTLRGSTESFYVFDVVLDVMNVSKVGEVFERVFLELKSREPGLDVVF
jgi:small conductance mechanosensitive channel